LNKTNILIYVWIGEEIPNWAFISIDLAIENSNCNVYLLTSKYSNLINKKCIQIEIQSFYNSNNSLLSLNNDKFRDGFWIKTTERFFILRDFVFKNSIKSFFHAELDNLIFDISELNYKLDNLGSGIFLPKDSINRCIASLIYINNPEVLQQFCEYVCKNPNNSTNDMLLLGDFSNVNKNVFFLPNEVVFNDFTDIDYLHKKDTGGIFDAAAIGQYLFGIDPRNSKLPIFNKFINENSKFDLRNCTFKISITSNNASINDINLFNIHIHSKIFEKLIDENWLNYLVKRLNKKKRTLIIYNILCRK